MKRKIQKIFSDPPVNLFGLACQVLVGFVIAVFIAAILTLIAAVLSL